MEQFGYFKKVDISELKHSFSKQYLNSVILSMLLDLPDMVSGTELIGATAILLDILDRENHKNMNGGM